MRLEDLYARAQFFAAQDDAARPSRRAARAVRDHRRRGRADLKTDLLQELERQKQLLAPLRTNPAIEPRVLEPLLAEIDARQRAACSRRRARSAQHLRDNEWLMAIKQRTGDSRRRLRVRPARLPLLAATATRRRGSNDLAGWIEPFAADPRRARDRPAAAARQRPRQPAHRVPRRVPADADDDQGRAAAAAHRRARPRPACRRSAPTSTRSTSASSASRGMDRGARLRPRRRVRAGVLQSVTRCRGRAHRRLSRNAARRVEWTRRRRAGGRSAPSAAS